MAKRLDLRDVALTELGGGRFTGTGKMAEGQVVKVEVVQEERRLSWTTKWEIDDAKGWKSRGSGSGSVSR